MSDHRQSLIDAHQELLRVKPNTGFLAVTFRNDDGSTVRVASTPLALDDFPARSLVTIDMTERLRPAIHEMIRTAFEEGMRAGAGQVILPDTFAQQLADALSALPTPQINIEAPAPVVTVMEDDTPKTVEFKRDEYGRVESATVASD